MRFDQATDEDLVGRLLGTNGTFAVKVVKVIGKLPGSPAFWIWGQNCDPMNDDLHRWCPYYPEEEIPFIRR